MSARGDRVAELDDLQRRPRAAHAPATRAQAVGMAPNVEDPSGPVSDVSTLQVAPRIGARSSGLKIVLVAERSPGVAPADAS